MIKKFLKSFILITFGVLIAGVLVNAAQYYRVNNGATVTINEWDVCKKVTNNTGKDIFVPTNSSNEWNQFRTYFPSGVSLGTCTTLTVQSTPITGVAITSSSGHQGTTNYSKDVTQGTTVSLTAPTTVSGYSFLNWSGCVSSTNTTISFSMPANDTNCVANYKQLFVTVRSIGISGVAITSSSGHGGTTTYSKNVPRGTTVSLTAPTVSGYTFNWSGCVSSTNTTISFSMPANDTNCVANYCNPEFTCGDPVTFTYKGSQVTYGTVAHNCRCWMDRNLGASRVALSSTDSSAYGDLFQWGRLDDGHQNRTSLTTTTLSTSDNPGHNKFILSSSSPYDWRSPQNNNLWQGVNGINNPCPAGWRIPTKSEWETEYLGWSSKNSAGAFASPLKLTTSYYRGSSGGIIGPDGSTGIYWSSSISGSNAWVLNFWGENAYMYDTYDRADGFSVRCIKD